MNTPPPSPRKLAKPPIPIAAKKSAKNTPACRSTRSLFRCGDKKTIPASRLRSIFTCAFCRWTKSRTTSRVEAVA